MKFTKMQGIGNDYVYVNCFEEKVEDPGAVARFVSDRHFGIGSDGLILIKPSKCADFEMDMYNADGSQGAMCGNGIRCVAKYVYDYGLTEKKNITISTKSGIKYLQLTVEDGKVREVCVNMGRPILEPARIPFVFPCESEKKGEEETAVHVPLMVLGKEYFVTCVSMGNPHCITVVEDTASWPMEQIGPAFENHPAFPDRVNTEFIQVLDRRTVRMRVWERGAGETWACGTGACAVAVACVLNGYTEKEVTVKLLGGDLRVYWNEEDGCIYMTGPAATVFDGEIDLADVK